MLQRKGLAIVLGAVLLGGGSAPAQNAPGNDLPVASDVRIAGDNAATRFVVDLDKSIDIRAFTLANPYRVVIDMPQVTFQLPRKAGVTGRGLIKAFRFGLVMQGGSRMVIDLVRPARIDKAFVLEAANEQPPRLVLELAATDREAFLRTTALNNRQPDAPLRPVERADTKPDSDPRPLIVIDPGHGGIDNGTRAPSGENEKTLVLDFSLALRDKLEKAGRFRVLMTRSDDTYVALNERVRIARANRASLFISIHADALVRRDSSAQGVTVYTLSERASDAAAARLAEAENRADIIAGLDLSAEPPDVADILIDLAKRETKTFSVLFARTLIGQMRGAAKLHQNPLKFAGFRVLKAPDVPSVLVELGFVTNKEDVKALTSETWRSRATGAVVQAIDAFFKTQLAGGRN
ncbi:MAG: N-acetylmuramoyl-L-alanine amidase [Pseudolabrys sp.]